MQSWTSTGYFSNSTSSFVTNCWFSPTIDANGPSTNIVFLRNSPTHPSKDTQICRSLGWPLNNRCAKKYLTLKVSIELLKTCQALSLSPSKPTKVSSKVVCLIFDENKRHNAITLFKEKNMQNFVQNKNAYEVLMILSMHEYFRTNYYEDKNYMNFSMIQFSMMKILNVI